MVIYLISIAFFVYAFFNGFGENNKKSKTLTLIAVVVAGYDLFYIVSGNISQSFLINLLLCIIPIGFFLVGLLFLFDNSSSDSKVDSNTNKDGPKKEQTFKVDITDNEVSSHRHPETDTIKTSPSDNEPLNFQNAKVEGFGSCDVMETPEYIKITMHSEGKEYEFYVKDANIVAYRIEGMSKPQSY